MRNSIQADYNKAKLDGSISLESDVYNKTIQVGEAADGSQSLDKLGRMNGIFKTGKQFSTVTSPK